MLANANVKGDLARGSVGFTCCMIDETGPRAEKTMDVPQGQFVLRLRHASPASTLRAWDAADEYLLRELSETPFPRPVVVVGDRAGALACALHGTEVVWHADSATGRLAMLANLRTNGLDPAGVTVAETSSIPAGVAAAIIKIPKSLDELARQLFALRDVLPEGAPVLGAGMAKYLPSSVREMFERIIGPTDQSLAWKKSRVLRSVVDADLDPGPAPEPTRFALPGGEQIVGLPGVFGASGLDGGTRMLVDHVPDDVGSGTIVDLGCGTGVVGIVAMRRNPQATVLFRDDRVTSVESARLSIAATFGAGDAAVDRATFEVADGLDGVADSSVDVVLLNPPFHDGHAVSTDIARRLMIESRRVLAPGGRLIVVGNRHLEHHMTLRKQFGNCNVLASDRRFVVLQAQSEA